jgi:hypothetical protein
MAIPETLHLPLVLDGFELLDRMLRSRNDKRLGNLREESGIDLALVDEQRQGQLLDVFKDLS